MNDDDVLPTNVVDSSSSKGDEAVGSGSLEIAPLKGNVIFIEELPFGLWLRASRFQRKFNYQNHRSFPVAPILKGVIGKIERVTGNVITELLPGGEICGDRSATAKTESVTDLVNVLVNEPSDSQ
ncbi:hypothetical protein Q3G72_013668 [Acer saccharum]|nr:hypothetical protein Q3G72_013668 [Acer saccharum]